MQYYFSTSDGAGEVRRCLLDALNNIRVSAPSSYAKDRIIDNLRFILQFPEAAYTRNRDLELQTRYDRAFEIEQKFGKPFQTDEWGTIYGSVQFSWSKMYDEHLEVRFHYSRVVSGPRRDTIESGNNIIVFFRNKVKCYTAQGDDQVTLFEN